MSTHSVAAGHGLLNERSLRDWLLFPLSVSSGAVDVISFLALGKVFTAAMSGNFALLGIGIAGNVGAPNVTSVLASMAGFMVGNYVAARIATPYPGEHPRAAEAAGAARARPAGTSAISAGAASPASDTAACAVCVGNPSASNDDTRASGAADAARVDTGTGTTRSCTATGHRG